MYVRVWGADLLTVHVQLNLAAAGEPRQARLDGGRPAHQTTPYIRAEIAA